ncbi:thioredoxin family protein [uncultured Hymenobacter sp.]|uniref:thioredoxin family protein n=1 Tax=uncultured Hymenobacter sp. TaxID=170016 RepID=UPI0035CAFC65
MSIPTSPLSAGPPAPSYTYAEFQHLVGELAAAHRTTGPDQLPLLLHNTAQNVGHLDRAHRDPLLPEVAALARHVPASGWEWVVLAEAWCGDTAHALPVLARLAEASAGRISLHVLLRSDHPAVMAAHQTNGKNSIPKLICLDAATRRELGSWGPRPAEAQALSTKLHEDKNLRITQIIKQMNAWYETDRGLDIQRELLALLPSWAVGAVAEKS